VRDPGKPGGLLLLLWNPLDRHSALCTDSPVGLVRTRFPPLGRSSMPPPPSLVCWGSPIDVLETTRVTGLYAAHLPRRRPRWDAAKRHPVQALSPDRMLFSVHAHGKLCETIDCTSATTPRLTRTCRVSKPCPGSHPLARRRRSRGCARRGLTGAHPLTQLCPEGVWRLLGRG
jgi:hypothetical protein